MNRIRSLDVVGAAILLWLAYAVVLPGACLAWTIETVEGNVVGAYSNLKIGPGDVIHIAHFAGASGTCRYSYHSGSSWTNEPLDSQYLSGHYPSLALGHSGDPHAAYRFYSGRSIRYASRSITGWTYTEFETDPDMEADISLALDSAERPHVAFWDGEFAGEANDLKYASFDGVQWTSEVVDSEGDVGRGCSLAIDSQDHPHISYYDVTNLSLKHATFDGSQWIVETVDDDLVAIVFNFRTAIAVDSHDRVHIAYSAYHYEAPDWMGQMKYARNDGSGWSIQVVEQALRTRDYRIPAIVTDSEDMPRITYLHYYNVETNPSELRYAFPMGATWVAETIDTGIPDSQYSNSIDVDSHGQPHVSYASDAYTLKHAVGEMPVSVEDPLLAVAAGWSLALPFPNPSNLKTGPASIAFSLDRETALDLGLFDVAGRRLATLARGSRAAGLHSVPIDLWLAPGTYLCRMTVGTRQQTRKLVVR